jgi:hypothetical protein
MIAQPTGFSKQPKRFVSKPGDNIPEALAACSLPVIAAEAAAVLGVAPEGAGPPEDAGAGAGAGWW